MPSAEAYPYDPAAPIWRPIASDRLDANSAAWASRLNARATDVYRAKSSAFGEAPPVYVASQSDDMYAISWTSGGAQSSSFPVPATAVDGGGADFPLVVQAPFTVSGFSFPQVEMRCFQATINHVAKTVSATNVNFVYYNNDGQYRGGVISDGRKFSGLGGNTGSGMSYTCGMIRAGEVADLLNNGVMIKHALRCALHADAISIDFRTPALASDQTGVTSATEVPMGTRFRLKSSVNINARTVPNYADNGATKLGANDPHTKLLRGLCWTLQNYGIVILDGTASGILFYYENNASANWSSMGFHNIVASPAEAPFGDMAWFLRDNQWASPDIPRTATDGIPWDQFEVVEAQTFTATPRRRRLPPRRRR